MRDALDQCSPSVKLLLAQLLRGEPVTEEAVKLGVAIEIACCPFEHVSECVPFGCCCCVQRHNCGPCALGPGYEGLEQLVDGRRCLPEILAALGLAASLGIEKCLGCSDVCPESIVGHGDDGSCGIRTAWAPAGGDGFAGDGDGHWPAGAGNEYRLVPPCEKQLRPGYCAHGKFMLSVVLVLLVLV